MAEEESVNGLEYSMAMQQHPRGKPPRWMQWNSSSQSGSTQFLRGILSVPRFRRVSSGERRAEENVRRFYPLLHNIT